MRDEMAIQEARVKEKRVLVLSLFGCFAYCFAIWLGARFFVDYYAFIPCVGLVLLSCVLHNLKNKDKTCLAAALCNACASGFAVSVYFTALGIVLPPLVLAFALAAMLLLLVCTYFAASSRLSQRALSVIITIVYLLVLACLVVLWLTRPKEDPMWALCTLSFLFYTFSLIPMLLMREEDDTSADRTVSFWSFSVAIVVVLAVLLAIAIFSGDGCDADCGDCCDCDLSGGGKRKKK